MPMPGSQRMESVDLAYFIYQYRWIFRIAFSLLILSGIASVVNVRNKWLPIISFLLLAAVIYVSNYPMMAENMFKQPGIISFKNKSDNKVPSETLLISITNNGEAKGYPVRYIAYHHQVRDKVGGKPVMVTYCSVCRTGRVFLPMVNGKEENFRLVGMDHFNAMFEDETTKSWWRQATGEAVTGALKGNSLPEFESYQLSLEEFFERYPDGQVMQPDPSYEEEYESLVKFEKGTSTSSLVGTDTNSWKDKSWVVGVVIGNVSKAYDWNELKKQRIINDNPGNIPVVIVINDDGKSFGAFKRNSESVLSIKNNILFDADSNSYRMDGTALGNGQKSLEKLPAYQEFWHSWKTFHPFTLK